MDAHVIICRQCCQLRFLRLFCPRCGVETPRLSCTFMKFLHSMQKKAQLETGTSVDVSMRTMESFRKLADIKKDARLTIRIPRELKAKIEGIDRVYGVALPKIANECLRAFCDYVEQMKQTPTFPLSIGPSLPGEKTPNRASVGRGRGIHNGHRRAI
jgi:hypothetical protein